MCNVGTILLWATRFWRLFRLCLLYVNCLGGAAYLARATDSTAHGERRGGRGRQREDRKKQKQRLFQCPTLCRIYAFSAGLVEDTSGMPLSPCLKIYRQIQRRAPHGFYTAVYHHHFRLSFFLLQTAQNECILTLLPLPYDYLSNVH